MPARLTGDPDYDGKVLQLAMAFGQGAGTMLATGAALLAALEPYAASIQRISNAEWDDEGLGIKVVEYTRALGAVAAAAAARDREFVIGVEHVNYALGGIKRTGFVPLLGPCGC